MRLIPLILFFFLFGAPRLRAIAIFCIVTAIAFAISSTLGVISIIAFFIMSIKCYIFDSGRMQLNIFNFWGYDEQGYNRDGFNIKGYSRAGYNKNGYDKDGYDKNGWNKNKINKQTHAEFDKSGYDYFGRDRKGYDKDGFNVNGINRDTGTTRDRNGFDKYGYNKYGFNRCGINKYTGSTRDKDGFDIWGQDEQGYNRDGFNFHGYDRNGYDKNGYDKNGFDKYGYDKNGYTKEGYGRNGFDKYGYDRNGFDKYGYDRYGFNVSGINKKTKTKYDEDGFDKDGYDKNGYDENGINKEYLDRRGFGYRMLCGTFGRTRFSKFCYDGKENKYTGTMYDKNGLDYYGNPKKMKKITKKSTNIKDNGTKEEIESLKICSIASGSNGNCYYIGTDNNAILIDDGISYKQLSLRMKEVNLDINSIKGIFISHEHVDHIRGLPIFYKNHPNVPIYFNENAYRSVKYSNDPSAYRRGVVNLEEKVVNLGGFKIYPFKKKHDASYPLSFRIEYNGISIGIFTDIGEHSTTFRNHFSKCNAVFLEANHDVTMLRNCSRPRDVIERIYETHFSNDNAYDMLNDYANPDLQVVILAHISEDNNSNRKIMEKFAKFERKYKLEIASRYGVGKVHKITN